jgi:hypothetical protein
MHQRLHDLLVAFADKAIRVERELVLSEFADATGEAIRRKVADRIRLSLVRYKNVRQRAVE